MSKVVVNQKNINLLRDFTGFTSAECQAAIEISRQELLEPTYTARINACTTLDLLKEELIKILDELVLKTKNRYPYDYLLSVIEKNALPFDTE